MLGAARIGLYFYLNVLASVLVCFVFPCAPVFVGIFLFEGRADEKGIWKDDVYFTLLFTVCNQLYRNERVSIFPTTCNERNAHYPI